MCFCGLMGAVMTEIKYSCSSSQRRSRLLFSACKLKSGLVSLLKYLVFVVLSIASQLFVLLYFGYILKSNYLSVVLSQSQF